MYRFLLFLMLLTWSTQLYALTPKIRFTFFDKEEKTYVLDKADKTWDLRMNSWKCTTSTNDKSPPGIKSLTIWLQCNHEGEQEGVFELLFVCMYGSQYASDNKWGQVTRFTERATRLVTGRKRKPTRKTKVRIYCE